MIEPDYKLSCSTIQLPSRSVTSDLNLTPQRLVAFLWQDAYPTREIPGSPPAGKLAYTQPFQILSSEGVSAFNAFW